MPQYIKSHSNYVLKKKHQDVADGTIWERDITTIGGVNNFSPGQIPIYKTNNFIITVRDDGKTANQHNRSKWVQNGTSGDVWTMSVVENETSGDDDQNDLKIVLKQDYYDFCDFAYYGSLNEMFRASINDIFRRFPGELYCTDEKVYYNISSSSSSTLGSGGFECLVSNPFNINIHSVKKPIDGEELKFFANDGYKNYTIGRNPVTSWTSTYYYSEYNKETKKYDWYSASTSETRHCYSSGNTYPYPCKPNDKLADITINGTQIKAYIGGNNDVVYLTKSNEYGTYIRPSEKFLVKFYNECDNFEKLILNPKTTPKYKSTFSVIKEGERGYYRELEEFVFPTTYGGYNVDASAYGFNSFTKRLSDIGLFYDEYFTDNLWRAMTHEAIKNFDWTYTREFYQGDDDEYIHGGEKIQKALRVFAREFDEILSYIDAVKSTNRVTYDERSNVPDYFLLDKLEERGWDVKMTYPYIYSNEDKKYSQKLSGSVKPYTSDILKYPNGYFVLPCESGNFACYYKKIDNKHGYAYIDASGETTSSYTKTSNETIILNRNKAYSSEREYTYVDANNEFMRRMVINSPYIFRHKGTIEGIEMTLGMFGLKSGRWCAAHNNVDPCNNVTADYDITEYTRFAERIEEKWDAVHQMYRFDWINSTKTIVYDYRSTSNYTNYGAQFGYIPYQGLPVAYRDEEIISTKCSGGGDTYICSDTSDCASGCTCVIESGDTSSTCIINCPFIKVSPLYSDPHSAQCVTCDVEEAFKRIDEDNAPVFRRYLYPNFSKYEQIDGNPYFQMNGGWLSKKMGDKYIQFDVDDNLVESDEPIYKETVRNIKRVNTLTDLLSTPIGTVKDGTIYYVSNIGNDLAAIDDAIYEVKYEYCGECEDGTSTETPPIKRYISLIKGQEYIKVGSDKFFDTTIMVYDENGEMATYSLIDKDEGYEVKAYIKDNPSEGEREFICQANSEGTYTIESFVLINKDEEDMTNYFIINDAYYSNRLAYKIKLENSEDDEFVWSDGWRRLRNDDTDYLKANTITNYFEGNNPHNGNMVYDGGKEYYTYFERLFKHAIDNELFDERCYESFYNDLDEEISKIGFDNITLIEDDPKIHYFGEYYDKKNIVQTSSLSSGLLCKFDKYPNYCDDDTTNQIMNDKALKITFYLNKSNDPSELKYIDDIVLNYLTQVIPSTSIVEIEYANKENN